MSKMGRLFTGYEELRKRNRSMISEHEKACTDKQSDNGEQNSRQGEIKELAMGTTILALFCERCVVVAWDSRTTSAEYIMDDETPDKMFKITPNKVCIKAGAVDALNAMQRHVQEKFKKRLDKQKPFSVLDASSSVFKKLVQEDEKTECLITGWDETLKRFDMWHAHSFPPTELRRVENYQACGSGRTYALQMLEQLYKPNMCVDEAEEVAIRCLLEAGFYEPCTGGALKVFRVQKNGCEPLYNSIDALKAYYDYYDVYSKLPVLFMFVPRNCEPFAVYKYQMFFRKEFKLEILAAHVVAIKRHFTFHRLVLHSEEDLSKVYKEVKKIGPLRKAQFHLSAGEEPYIARFQNGFYYYKLQRMHPMYVEKNSLELLQDIRNMD